MSNIGDDIYGGLSEVAKKNLEIMKLLLEVLLHLMRWSRERHILDIKLPVKYGEISQKAMDKLIKAGDKPRTTEIPAEKAEEFHSLARKLGAQYAVLETGGSTITLSVPESSLQQVNDAIAKITQKMLSEDPQSVKVHGRDEAIKSGDRTAVNEALYMYNVPMYRYEREDGSQVNIVPAGSEELYDKAMTEAKKALDHIKNDMVIEKFIPSQEFEKADHTIRKAEPLEAADLADMYKEVEVFRDESGQYAVKYPDSLEESISAQTENVEQQTEGIQTTVVDSSVSINESLIEKEYDNAYLVRIPGTGAKDFMMVDKSAVDTERSTDKTKYVSLEKDKVYSVCDSSGTEKDALMGETLLEKWKTKNVLGNRDTEATAHGNANLERIEVYDPIKNRLMKIEMNANIARQTLKANGFGSLAADKILEDVSRKMTAEQRRTFGFKREEPVKSKPVSDAELENMLTENRMAHLVKGAEFHGNMAYEEKNDITPFVSSKEECYCIFDKTSKSYTFVNQDTDGDDLRSALREMGCTDVVQNALYADLLEKYRLNEEKLESPVKGIDSDMSELQGLSYIYSDELKSGIMAQITENEGAKYFTIENGTSRAELEKMLTDKNKFGFSDKAAAEVINCLYKSPELSRLTEEAEREQIDKSDLSILPLTSKFVSVSDGQKDIVVSAETITAELLRKQFGLPQEQSKKLSEAIKKGIETGGRSKDGLFRTFKSFLNKVHKHKQTETASESIKTVMDEKGKASETRKFNKSTR